MNKSLNALIVAVACLVMLPLSASAQLPSPTYGWNLGNTLEPPCGVGCWDPAPTQALINSVAAAGFNTIRIPCAWDSHANQSTYQIDSTYMAQVKQVIDWCYAKNLYVVVNDHWDDGWLENNITGTVNSTINAKMRSYWTQIATAFGSYDSHLLFAGANEPAVDNAAKMSELTTYYQTFITAVRGTGGNNTSRWLVIQGPSTDIDTTDSLMNTLPSDPTAGRLMVEVHYYAPYQYCLMSADASWGNMFYFWGAAYHSATMTTRNPTWGEEAYVDTEFAKMQAKFSSKGIPVVLGEFGAMRRTSYSDLTGTALSLHLASRTYFDKYVVASARSHGMYPIYWDDGGTGNNSMGLFDRNSATLVDADSARALTGGAALPPPGTVPSAPTGLSATAGNAQATLSWSAASGATSYNVYRGTTAGGESTTAIATGITTTSYTNTGLTNGTTYYYKVAAVNSSGTSSLSNEASATPAGSTYSSGIANGNHTLTPQNATSARLDAAAKGTTNGTKVEIWASNGGTNQSWTFTNLGSGIYKITASYATSLCLDVSNSGGSGSNVDLWACSGANNQKWGAISISGNIYSLAPQNATSTRLDVNGNGTANGTQVDIYNSNGNNNQKWAVN